MIFNLKRNDREFLKNYIETNGYFSVWFMLFDMLHNELYFEDKDNKYNKDIIIMILKILSLNRKDKNNSLFYFIPIPFIIDNELKEILLCINGDSKNNKYSFIAYDNEENKELCKIIIERFENEYLITLKLFDKNLYKKCRDTKYIIDEELKIFDNLKLKMEYANE